MRYENNEALQRDLRGDFQADENLFQHIQEQNRIWSQWREEQLIQWLRSVSPEHLSIVWGALKHRNVGAVDTLFADIDSWYQHDERHLPPGRFIRFMHKRTPDVLCWLTYFVARRALPCWEGMCRDRKPRQIIEGIGRYLKEGAEVNWEDAVIPVPSPYNDCTCTFTSSASHAIAECARYIQTKDPLAAWDCIDAVICAYDHVFTEDRFREWITDIAVPIAFERREMTTEEQEALRAEPRDYSKPHPKSR